jgi:hypothetical protein
MKTNIKIAATAIAAFSLLFLTMCKKTEPGSSGPNSNYNVYMTDSPGDYQEVNVNITGVEINTGANGWTALNVNAGIYNLLTLCNGKDILLATGSISASVISQIRLTIGSTGNTIKVNNTIYPLVIPSGSQSGLKVVVNGQLSSDNNYTIALDFDAGMSIVATGSGTYILKPVIRAIVVPTASGSIKGTISPAGAEAAVFAITGPDSASTYSSIVSGNFMIQGLASGTYKVVVMPMSPFSIATYSNIAVSSGSVTSMGTITVQ